MDRHELRPYQKNCLNNIYKALKTENKALYVGATGCGKTLMMCRLAELYYQRERSKILFLSHRKLINSQFISTLKTQTEIPVEDIGLCCASLNKTETDRTVTVGSVQTLIKNLDAIKDMKYIFIDEVHRMSEQHKKIVENCPEAKIIGITATPYRADEGLIYDKNTFFPRITTQTTYNELIEKGHLVPIRGLINCDNDLINDLETVEIYDNEYQKDPLSYVMEKKVYIDNIKKVTEQYGDKYKRCCIVCCTIKHAEKVHEIIPDSVILHSKLPQHKQDHHLIRWRSHGVKHIITVDMLSEGFDFPAMDCIILARPILSHVNFIQLVGRLMRPSRQKMEGLLIDITPSTQRIGLDFDNIRYPKIKKEQRKKKRPDEKMCPECYEICKITSDKCLACGFRWSEAQLLADIQKVPELKEIYFGKIEKKPKQEGLKTIKVDKYFFKVKKTKNNKEICQLIAVYDDRTTVFFFATEDNYKGYPVKKGKEQWQYLTKFPYPKTTEAFLKQKEVIKLPQILEVDFSDNFAVIIGSKK